jgi:hypothetical protein
MEPEGSLPHSQEPATCPYPEPAQSSSCSPPSHFWNAQLMSATCISFISQITPFCIFEFPSLIHKSPTFSWNREYGPSLRLVHKTRSNRRCTCVISTVSFEHVQYLQTPYRKPWAEEEKDCAKKNQGNSQCSAIDFSRDFSSAPLGLCLLQQQPVAVKVNGHFAGQEL